MHLGLHPFSLSAALLRLTVWTLLVAIFCLQVSHLRNKSVLFSHSLSAVGVIEQRLFTTHITWFMDPRGKGALLETNMRSSDFYHNKEDDDDDAASAGNTLARSFRVIYYASLIMQSLLAKIIIVATLQMSPFFQKNSFRIQHLCALPTMGILSTIFLMECGLLYLTHAIYTTQYRKPDAVNASAAASLGIGRIADSNNCNPFDGCIESFEGMGFKRQDGYACQVLSIALTLLAFGAQLSVYLCSRSIEEVSVMRGGGDAEDTERQALLTRDDEDALM